MWVLTICPGVPVGKLGIIKVTTDDITSDVNCHVLYLFQYEIQRPQHDTQPHPMYSVSVKHISYSGENVLQLDKPTCFCMFA